jgi:plasmid stabilization system protein ParE
MLVIFEPDAEAEFAEACTWYRSQRNGLDRQLIQRVEETLQHIVDAPNSYPIAHQKLRRAAVKQFPFIIFYETVDDIVRVFAVYHTKRNPERIM